MIFKLAGPLTREQVQHVLPAVLGKGRQFFKLHRADNWVKGDNFKLHRADNWVKRDNFMLHRADSYMVWTPY